MRPKMNISKILLLGLLYDLMYYYTYIVHVKLTTSIATRAAALENLPALAKT